MSYDLTDDQRSLKAFMTTRMDRIVVVDTGHGA